MGREKKDAVRLNIKLDRNISERLDRYCEVKGQTKTTAIERILAECFNEHDKNEKDPKKRTR